MSKLEQIRNKINYSIGIFEGYAQHHKNKGDDSKANNNEGHAKKLIEALKPLNKLEETEKGTLKAIADEYMVDVELHEVAGFIYAAAKRRKELEKAIAEKNKLIDSPELEKAIAQKIRIEHNARNNTAMTCFENRETGALRDEADIYAEIAMKTIKEFK